MAHHKSALKRIKTAEKARLVNRKYKKALKETVKDVMTAKSGKEAEPNLKKAVSILDRLVVKNVVNKNKASREKSKLTKFVNGIQ